MLASSPASILNQNLTDLGIPNRFNPSESDSRVFGTRVANPILAAVMCDRINRPHI